MLAGSTETHKRQNQKKDKKKRSEYKCQRIQIERHGDGKSCFKIVIAHIECFPNLTAFLQL